ncbi:TonB-dependent receptor [Dyadobacter fanqingshengii]|uniref:TonB-dependent receptor n=1 Tax=Dyadobacter fanqingshengii TaxID=2906443 RepID=A0A9X1PB61_9BACT|nr:TonB-dependent receptor [Dyadobacter fanqingshengii]MCF0041350.1 TonB-dependent receptor [Dyadobacter fanqingshengii]USJ36927.2 TonB-dependent receptor [Dyadobacter fanqingshengii]
MYIKYLSLLIFVTTISTNVFAQPESGILNGRIVNSVQQAISGASVTLQSTDFGTITDADGQFRLTGITPGSYILSVSNIGYTAYTQSLRISKGKNSFLNLQLSESREELAEVVVSTAKTRYQVLTSSASTRSNTPLLSTPQSVQVLSSAVLRDRQAFTLNEIAGSFTGMKANNGNGNFQIRGFTAYSPNDASFLLYNGIRGNLFLWSQQPLLYNIESVELLRGPSGALFSEGSPGGVVNFITKKPLSEKRASVDLSLGSWGFGRASLDFTGPVDRRKKLLYRAIIGYDRSESFRDYQEKKNLFIAPSLTYLFNRKTSLNLELNYAYQKAVQQYDNGSFVYSRPDGSFDFNYYPNNLTIQSPTDYGKTHNASATLTFDHQISNNLKLTVVERAVRNVLDYTDHIPVGRIRNDSISRGFQDWETDRFSLQTTAFATYTAKTGPLGHQLTAGSDYNRYGWTQNDYQYKSSTRISILHPDYAGSIPDASVPADESDDNKRVTNLIGAYIQDQVSVGNRFKVLLSLRYDNYNGKETPLSDRDNKQGDALQASGWIPRIGLVYLPLKNVSIYGTFLKSFNPQTSNNVLAGGPFPTRKATQYEVGSKADLLSNRLSATLSLYQIDYANILTAAPTDENSHRQAAIDGTRSRGGEFSVTGNLNALSLIAGYAFNEHVLVSTSTYGKKGDRFANAPKHQINFWGKYAFPSGVLKGFGVAAGVRYASDQVGLLSNQNFIFPSYTVLDAALSYQRNRFQLQVNAYNLANKHYFTGSRSGVTLAGLGDPFNVRVGITYQLW